MRALALPDSKQLFKKRRTKQMATKKDFTNNLENTLKKAQKEEKETGARINVLFDAELYDYIKTMSALSGGNTSKFLSDVVRAHMNNNLDNYKFAKKQMENFKINF